MFGSNDLNHTVEALGQEINSGAHEHVFCSAVDASLWYEAFAFEEKIEQAGTKEDSGGGVWESKESKTVELLPSSRIGNSALRYIFASGNYQELTATKRKAYLSVVEMVLRF